MRKRGWLWFWLWTIPGVTLGFQVSVIGVLLLPLGLIATLLLAWFSRPWPEALGIAAGVGLTCLAIALIAVLNGNWPGSCPSSGEIVTRTSNSVMAESCDRWYALPWAIAGLLFILGGALAYRIAAGSRRSGPAVAL